MGHGLSLFIDMNKNYSIDLNNRFLRKFISDLAPDTDGGPAKGDGFHSNFNNIPQTCRTDKINFSHEFGNQITFSQLAGDKNSGLLINPAKDRAAKQGPMGIQVLGFY